MSQRDPLESGCTVKLKLWNDLLFLASDGWQKNFSIRSIWEVSAIIVLHSEAKPRLVCRGLYWLKIQGVSRTFEHSSTCWVYTELNGTINIDL